MNKNNENENKPKSNSQAFNDKIAMFNMNTSKSQSNQLPPKKIQNSSNNKTMPDSKKEKIQNENQKEEKNVLKIINQINNKNNLNDNKVDKEKKQPIENKNFKASLSVFSNKVKEIEEKENEKKNNNNDNNSKENPVKQKEKKNKNIIPKKEEKGKEKIDNKPKKEKTEKNNQIQIEEKEKENNSEKNIKEININKYEEDKDKEDNKNKEMLETNEERKRSLTIKERLKRMNIDQKKPKENSKNITNKEKQSQKIIGEKPEKKEEIENNDSNNNSSNKTVEVEKKIQTNNENEILTETQEKQEKIIIPEDIQKKLQNPKNTKQTNINKEKENNPEKNKVKNNNSNLTNMERLKSIYQPNPKEKISESTSNKNISSINNNNAPKKNEEIFLQSKLISKNEKYDKDSFCDSFFMASFSKDNCQILENSNDIPAECNHPNCSILPAISPEIVFKYPPKDRKELEINNVAASVCFPNGIKLCYEENEEYIIASKDFSSAFTSQIGDRFFAITYHFYLKKKNSEFESEQNMTPFKYEKEKYKGKETSDLNVDQNKDSLIKFNILRNLAKKEYVYIPYCACLISKYPFINQIEKSLESIIKAICDEKVNKKDLNKYISYIVNSIPSPPYHSKILFPLAYNNKLAIIQYPYFKDLNKSMDNPLIILDYINEENILILFKLLIFEQKILIVGKDIDIVSQIILNFVTLLYPFEWIHTFIPVMSEKMINLLQAFLPFFNGMNTILFKKAKPILENAPDGIFIYNMDSKTFELNNNYKSDTVIPIESNIQNFPKYIEQLILKELKGMKTNFLKAKEMKDFKEILSIHFHLKNLFLQIFTELLYDYKKYSHIVDNFPVFNKSLLVKDKGKESDFYLEFTSTQLFQMFIQNSLLHPENKEYYFEKRLSDYDEIKKMGATKELYIYDKLTEKYKVDTDNFFKLNKTYVMKPYFIKEFKDYEKNLSKKINISDITQFLLNHYNQPNYANMIVEGILPANKRIFNGPIELSNDDDPEKIEIYYPPEQKKEIDKKFKSELNTNENSSSKLKEIKMIEMGPKKEEIKNNEIKISESLLNKENKLTEEEMDDIKDNIKEIMTRMYRSDLKKIEQDKNILIDSLKTKFGRDYFINILSNGYKQDNLVKNLVNESYYFFSEVIFDTLSYILKLEENDENMVNTMKLLKSCQYIGTTKNKKKLIIIKSKKFDSLLSDEIYSKLENYTLFNNKRFWEIWIDDDLKKDELNIKKLLKENSYKNKGSKEYKSYIKNIYSLLEKLILIMIKINIDSNTIFINMNELAKEYSLDENKKKQLKGKILEQIQTHKS